MMVMSRPLSGGGGDGFVGGGGNRVVTWTRDGNRVFLRGRAFNISADTSTAVYRVVSAANEGPIIAAFNVEAWGLDSAAVIDVTRLFTTAIPEFSAFNTIQADRRDRKSVV